MIKNDIHLTLDKYIDELIFNQNQTDTSYFKNMFSKAEYYALFSDVLNTINYSPNGTISTYRYDLFQKSGLANLIYKFVYERKLTPGLVVNFGTEFNRDIIICGRKQEVLFDGQNYIPCEEEMEYDTIFDLASTSKIFTTIAILKLCEAGLLDLNDEVVMHTPEFENLKGITIFDLLTFSKSVVTTTRVDTAENMTDAYNALLTIKPNPTPEYYYPYTDMGVMVLKILVERITNMPFNDFVKEEIFIPCKMEHTFLNVPYELTNKVANENYSKIVLPSGKLLTRYDNPKGTVHDKKSVAIGHANGNAPGHAGYFSNSIDMESFAYNLINGNIINKKHVQMLGTHYMGLPMQFNNQDTYSCHHGLLTFLKQKNPDFRSVQPFLSGKAFIQPGFAGSSLSVDPINKVYSFVAGNRLHNRVYQVADNQRHMLSTNEYGATLYNNEFIVSQSYTKECETLTQIAMKLALQYQLLEKLLGHQKELKLVREI